MRGELDAAKRRTWSDRLGRFARGDLTVADFCDLEGVSTASFYQWRRRLGRGAARRATPEPFLPVQVVPSPRTSAAVEIHLPNGARVSLAIADAPVMAAAIAAAAQAPASREA
jgi:hypothetical protein